MSLVRFADSENKRPVDNIRVFAEPDPDIAKLCYKRLQRRRHVDTMAFPEFASYLHEERMRQLQARERNFFENVGLESTWLIEFLPDQPFDLARISDVRVWFQYEALFDENLKRVLEPSAMPDDARWRRSRSGKTVREAAARRISPAARVQDRRAPCSSARPSTRRSSTRASPFGSKTVGPLEGPAALEIAYGDAPPVAVTTDDVGIVATAPEHPAGTGLAELAPWSRARAWTRSGLSGSRACRQDSAPTPWTSCSCC